jgi:hypothetical protein
MMGIARDLSMGSPGGDEGDDSLFTALRKAA